MILSAAKVSAVGEEVDGLSDRGADGLDDGFELLFVVGGVADKATYDEHRTCIDGGLDIVALLKAVAGFHDAAFGVGKVVLVFGARAFLGRLGFFATGLAVGGFFFFLTGDELGFILGLFFQEAFFGQLFHEFFGFGEFGDAVFTALDFFGNGEAVLERDGVGILRFGKEFLDLLLGEFHLLFKMAVAHRAVLAGVGEDLNTIDRNVEVADFQDPGGGGEFEDLVKGGREEFFVFAAEFADGIVVGMGVGGEEAHRDIFIGEGLDATA